MNRIIITWVSSVALAVSLAGCSSEDGSEEASGNGSTGIEVAGTWETNFATTEVITEDEWNEAEIVEYDNAENVAITQNPDDAQHNPSTFSRLVWTDPQDGTFYYCTVAFNLATLEEAQGSTATADDTDLEGAGCGGFAWTKMTR